MRCSGASLEARRTAMKKATTNGTQGWWQATSAAKVASKGATLERQSTLPMHASLRTRHQHVNQPLHHPWDQNFRLSTPPFHHYHPTPCTTIVPSILVRFVFSSRRPAWRAVFLARFSGASSKVLSVVVVWVLCVRSRSSERPLFSVVCEGFVVHLRCNAVARGFGAAFPYQLGRFECSLVKVASSSLCSHSASLRYGSGFVTSHCFLQLRVWCYWCVLQSSSSRSQWGSLSVLCSMVTSML